MTKRDGEDDEEGFKQGFSPSKRRGAVLIMPQILSALKKQEAKVWPHVLTQDMQREMLKLEELMVLKAEAKQVIFEWMQRFQEEHGSPPGIEDKKRMKPLYVDLKKVNFIDAESRLKLS